MRRTGMDSFIHSFVKIWCILFYIESFSRHHDFKENYLGGQAAAGDVAAGAAGAAADEGPGQGED